MDIYTKIELKLHVDVKLQNVYVVYSSGSKYNKIFKLSLQIVVCLVGLTILPVIRQVSMIRC